jgi:hypothetical protein
MTIVAMKLMGMDESLDEQPYAGGILVRDKALIDARSIGNAPG